jgi:hypothetical protein
MRASTHTAVAALAIVFAARCELLTPSESTLRLGTWGGDDAGVIVTDSGAHLHVGCTYGGVEGAIPIAPDGRFNIDETHNITAHPVDRGIFLPARLTGRLTFPMLTFTITVNDTVNHRTVVLGPKTVRFGQEPKMGPCPICRTPGERMSGPGTRNPGTARPAPRARS